jgi:hypothetical protein
MNNGSVKVKGNNVRDDGVLKKFRWNGDEEEEDEGKKIDKSRDEEMKCGLGNWKKKWLKIFD